MVPPAACTGAACWNDWKLQPSAVAAPSGAPAARASTPSVAMAEGTSSVHARSRPPSVSASSDVVRAVGPLPLEYNLHHTTARARSKADAGRDDAKRAVSLERAQVYNYCDAFVLDAPEADTKGHRAPPPTPLTPAEEERRFPCAALSNTPE